MPKKERIQKSLNGRAFLDLEEIPLCFPDRFDEQYLEFLLKILDIDRLAKSAIDRSKEIKDEEGKIKKYDKCVTIQFCGFAASTLLGSEKQGANKSKTINPSTKVHEAFSKLFDRANLKKLNDQNIYLKASFCLTYLFSDLPICLMKAEMQDLWEKTIDIEDIDNKKKEFFYESKPLTNFQFNSSGIYACQEESLRTVVQMIQNKNKDIVRLGPENSSPNTAQIRFNVVPSPLCGLIINNKISFSDPYLYSKLSEKTELALDYPVNVLLDSADAVAFKSLQDHFRYLWRHDLTLFCEDATHFTPEKYHGLKKMRTPEEVIARNWQQKEKAIKARMESTGFPVDEAKIKAWKKNLNRKFSLCTRKLEEPLQDPIPGKAIVTVGMDGLDYFYKIEFTDEGVVCRKTEPAANFLFCALAHYSFAIKSKPKKKPALYELMANKSKFETQLIECLDHSDPYHNHKGHKLVNKLFSLTPNFEFLVPEENITFEFSNESLIRGALYSTNERRKKDDKKLPKRSCLYYPEDDAPS